MARFLPLLKEEIKENTGTAEAVNSTLQKQEQLDARAKILEDRKKVIDDRESFRRKKNKSNTT
jgi:hypothetical protein